MTQTQKTQVSFYLIQNEQRQADLACRLCRKTLQKERQPMLILCHSTQQLEALDALLWQFDPVSFIPHDVDDPTSPICLSYQLPPQFQGICINLSGQAIQGAGIQRIVEIVENSEQAKTDGRQRFKAYRSMGLEPDTFKV